MRLVYGIDWSGAQRAGDKIWVATIDPARRMVLDVQRPWKSGTNPDVTDGVAGWLNALASGWVGLDSPFGVAAPDCVALLGLTGCDPFQWSHAFTQRYRTREAFVTATIEAKLVGRYRRATDARVRAPCAPLLFQLIHQTYATFRLISRLERLQVRVLPWEHAWARPVTLLETCPAVTLRSFGLSNRGYKLKANSKAVRQHLLEAILQHQRWSAEEGVRDAVVHDREGDALDAILCAIAASRACTLNHAEIAHEPAALDEGWIYV